MHNGTMTVNLDQVESVLKLADGVVWIVTAADGSRRGGLTATWLFPASIDPARPVVLAGIAPNHYTAELIERSRTFVAHLLRADQVRLAWEFAKDSGRERDKLAGLRFATGVTGAPILANCLAWLECRVFARYDTGDRRFYWADVEAGSILAQGPPLREQAFIGGLSPAERVLLAARREADAVVQRPLADAWRASLSKNLAR
jgi:flavin reductase (DIM6/NTAB) family NADH-FMN oxidoreductase RutF